MFAYGRVKGREVNELSCSFCFEKPFVNRLAKSNEKKIVRKHVKKIAIDLLRSAKLRAPQRTF